MCVYAVLHINTHLGCTRILVKVNSQLRWTEKARQKIIFIKLGFAPFFLVFCRCQFFPNIDRRLSDNNRSVKSPKIFWGDNAHSVFRTGSMRIQ